MVSITNMFLMWMTVIGVGVSRASNTVRGTDLASTQTVLIEDRSKRDQRLMPLVHVLEHELTFRRGQSQTAAGDATSPM